MSQVIDQKNPWVKLSTKTGSLTSGLPAQKIDNLEFTDDINLLGNNILSANSQTYARKLVSRAWK